MATTVCTLSHPPARPQENLHSWLTDKLGRDQFVVRYGDDTVVCWNDGRRCRADEVYKRTFWTESFVQWSPLGNMLATMHRQVGGGEEAASDVQAREAFEGQF